MSRARGSVLAILVLVLLTATSGAAPDPPPAPEEPDTQPAVEEPENGLPPLEDPGNELPPVEDLGDELLLFEDLPETYSASRRLMPIDWVSAALSVVTAEEIHGSGLTTIAEVLQFVPGMDVIPIDRREFAVGVRGLHGSYSDRMVTLIDGRSADNPVWGGSNLLWQPLLLEDIERIEVVRGPAGALWGANALNGIVNVITKEPGSDPGWLLSTTWNQFGESYSHLRWSDRTDEWGWRVSLGYEDRKDAEDTIDDAEPAGSDFVLGLDPEPPAVDAIASWRFDARADHRPAPGSTWSFGLAHQHSTIGSILPPGTPPDDGTMDMTRVFVGLDHDVGPESSLHARWYLNRLDYDDSELINYGAIETDLEAQVDFVPAPDHTASVGGHVRYLHASTDNDGDEPDRWNFAGAPFDETWFGLFAMDRFEISPRLAVEGQLRADWYSENGFDWAGRLACIHALDEHRSHILRAGVARAYRAPLLGLHASASMVELPSPPFPADEYAFIMREPDDLDNESTWSVEAGYRGRLSDWFTLRADAYYQRYEDLIGLESLDDPLGLGREIVEPRNLDGADSHGVEVEAVLSESRWRVSAWYAYHEFATDRIDQTIRALLPGKHKAGLTARWRMADGWSANLNYRYTTAASSDHRQVSPFGVGMDHRLDLSVAAEPTDSLEILVGVSDLLDETFEAVRTVRFYSYETPGRTFFLRLQLRF